MNLTGQAIHQKPEKVAKDPAYLARVRQQPCAGCGRHGPNEAHHCRDLPDFDEQGLYERLPGAAQTSGDHDAIPLCGPDGCHQMFHLRRSEFHARYGRDYTYIGTTRAALSDLEPDF